MKMYVEKGSILPGEESEAEKNQTKENRTSKKDISTYLTTGRKLSRRRSLPETRGDGRDPLRTWNSKYGREGGQTPRHPR